MSIWTKIASLKFWKNRSFWLLAALEGVLLLSGVLGLFGHRQIYEYGQEDMEAGYGYRVDASFAEAGVVMSFPGIALPRGTYQVRLLYSTDTDMKNLCTVTADTVSYKALLTNGGHLFAGLNQTDFGMWLMEGTSGLNVNVEYGGEGSLEVTGLVIQETNALSRMWLFIVVCGGLAAACIYIYVLYDRKYKISLRSKNTAFGLGLVILFSSLPLFVDYMISSGDLIYHLMRVEAIRDGLLSGQFPVRIGPQWQSGYGYASSIFYGETLLYIPALLRIIGFTVQTSYRIFMFLVNAATALIAYFCFRKIFKDQYIGLLCSALYTLSIYRIYKTYCAGSLGETFGVLFLPLLVYGFYRVFTQDVKEKDYKRSFIPLTIGFTGLIQSHLLTCELVGGFTILLCLILWKKVFRKETFLVLAKTVVYSALLSAWFLVPFLDYMMTGDFVIQHVSGRTIQERGLYPAHLLLGFFIRGGNVYLAENGMVNSDPMGIGIVLTAALLVWGGLLFFRKTGILRREEAGLGKICGAFSLMAMVMSLSLFPWDKIQALSGITATLVSSLQFPNRCLTIANVGLVAVAGVVASWTMKYEKNGSLIKGTYFGGAALLLVCGSLYLMNDVLYSTPFLRLYNDEGMGNGYIAGGEYLPYGADAALFTYRAPLAEENVTVEWYDKKDLAEDVTCQNDSGREGYLDLPLLYYKGYRAFDLETGEALKVYAGRNFDVTVSVPAGYSGTIRTRFVSPWYWRAGEAVSVVTFLALAGGFLWRWKRTGRREEVRGRE